MYTFKAQAKSNAKRFLVTTAKVGNFEPYLTQHEGQWGCWLNDAGVPQLAADAQAWLAKAEAAGVLPSAAEAAALAGKPFGTETVVAADTLPTAADTHAAANATATDANTGEPAEDDAPPAPDAFGAFALAQLTASNAPAPAPAPARPARGATPTAGLQIQKDRPLQNGVHRQSKGSVGDKLWALYDAEGPGVTLGRAKELATAAGLSPTSAAIALYNWRKFHGIKSSGK